MTRLARPAARLATGSATVARRLTRRAAAWVARGRRADLTGWRAALGCWLRITLLVFGLYLLWRIVRAVPALMWLLSGVWAIAAWRAGRGPVTEPAESPTEQPADASRGDVRAATLEWIWQRIGDRQGVHLRDLLAHAHAHGMFTGMEVAEFRGHLERWDIPVRARVRVRGQGVTVGIHRDDIQPLTSPSPEAAPLEAA
ncbi:MULTISPECIES: hypothetical protein [Streptomyces]|uniref:hypothetical protein n=1 Tax=Streptomyces TaxID=1883 RepID=UPI00073DEF1E|nr:hypothetical protein [Streptomyces sp. FBKL.4005]MYU28638.1 hypothetical protein [Streptomyces sp. SID7810]OYP17036.1 hypothetical protein CFC35_23100 [Streptomyces sp. FBKL.4005]CUW29677.1 hypothetical protein TUE45_04386 [Streptomyces reticuli]